MNSTTKKSPLGAIRAFCMECQGQFGPAVDACADLNCHIYSYRAGKPLASGTHRPLPAIRRYCLTYCQPGESSEEVKTCQGNKPVDLKAQGPCPLFPFRMGRNPNFAEGTREQRRLRASKMRVEGAASFVKNAAQ